MPYSTADTCPGCGRHPRPTEPLPKWIEHIAGCTRNPPRPDYRIGHCLDCDDEWRERTAPAVCPECHSLNVEEIPA